MSSYVSWFSSHKSSAFLIQDNLHYFSYIKDSAKRYFAPLIILKEGARLSFMILEQSVMMCQFLTNFRAKLLKVSTISAGCLLEIVIDLNQYLLSVGGQNHSVPSQHHFLLHPLGGLFDTARISLVFQQFKMISEMGAEHFQQNQCLLDQKMRKATQW